MPARKLNTLPWMMYLNLLETKTASSLFCVYQKRFSEEDQKLLYTCINIADGRPVASKYQIACAVNNSAYLSHHSAFEYMGISNQVFYEIYVSSEKRFDDFEFNGITYRYISSKMSVGVIKPKNTQGIRVTSLERTVVDSIKDFEKIGGLEELLNCIEATPYLKKDELIKCLDE